MHSFAFRADDRTFPHSIGNVPSAERGCPRRANRLGDYAATALVGTRLCHRDLGKVAPRQRRSASPLPTNRGFDEWYGIPRTYSEVFWPSLNDTHSLWPSVGAKQGWDPSLVPAEPIYEARKGERPRMVAELDLDHRRAMEKEITTRAVEFMKRTASSGKPFFAYVSFSLFHMPTLPNPEFARRREWRLGRLPRRDGLSHGTDPRRDQRSRHRRQYDRHLHQRQRPEATHPWEGDSGPWRGTYFTAMEASLRAPFVIRWPGKFPRAVSAMRSFTSWTCSRLLRT